MPTYEYACRDCDHRFDMVQSFTDDPLTVCPTCGGGLRKVFSAAGIIFKGSGYYVTDSRAESPASGNGDKKSDTAESSKSSKSSPSSDSPAPTSPGSSTPSTPGTSSGDASASKSA